MAKVYQGTIYVISPATKTIVLPDRTMAVTMVTLAIFDGATGAFGYSNLVNSFSGSIAHNDATDGQAITYYKDVNGVKTKVFEASVTGFPVGLLKLNITTCTTPRLLEFTVYGN